MVNNIFIMYLFVRYFSKSVCKSKLCVFKVLFCKNVSFSYLIIFLNYLIIVI